MSVLPIEVPSGSSKTWGSSNPFWSSQYSHWKWHLDHLRLWDHLQSFWIITDNTSMNKILFHPILRLKRLCGWIGYLRPDQILDHLMVKRTMLPPGCQGERPRREDRRSSTPPSSLLATGPSCTLLTAQLRSNQPSRLLLLQEINIQFFIRSELKKY